jgi:hypothetical protein
LAPICKGLGKCTESDAKEKGSPTPTVDEPFL